MGYYKDLDIDRQNKEREFIKAVLDQPVPDEQKTHTDAVMNAVTRYGYVPVVTKVVNVGTHLQVTMTLKPTRSAEEIVEKQREEHRQMFKGK